MWFWRKFAKHEAWAWRMIFAWNETWFTIAFTSERRAKRWKAFEPWPLTKTIIPNGRMRIFLKWHKMNGLCSFKVRGHPRPTRFDTWFKD
jgi:hypothetical protein